MFQKLKTYKIEIIYWEALTPHINEWMFSDAHKCFPFKVSKAQKRNILFESCFWRRTSLVQARSHIDWKWERKIVDKGVKISA